MEEAIRVRGLSKAFKTREHFSGILGAFKGLFFAKEIEVPAILDLSFTIKRGEKAAFIGPNGAGKSTTIKVLTGILYPSAGDVEVLGLVPWKERKKLSYQIGTIFGQRTQLWYHLPPCDTFDLLAKIYEIDNASYKRRLSTLVETFGIGPNLHKPVRQLSLGERMRTEIVASLLHNPKVLFLDEPTIGLDIDAKLGIRTLLNQLSVDQGITLFLTSHDTADIEQVVDRVIVLDKGTIIRDCSLPELKKSYIRKKVLTLITEEEEIFLSLPGVQVVKNEGHTFIAKVDTTQISIDKVIHEALRLSSLKDITIEDPSVEEIVRTLYGKG